MSMETRSEATIVEIDKKKHDDKRRGKFESHSLQN